MPLLCKNPHVLELNPENQVAGVLAPAFALRGAKDLGIGDTEALKELISWTARHGLSVVQILPINETGSDSSPYNLLSGMAIEPTTIATFPHVLPDLTQEDFDRITARFDMSDLCQGCVKHRELKRLKRLLLYAAFKTFRSRSANKARASSFSEFEKNNADWLPGLCDLSSHSELARGVRTLREMAARTPLANCRSGVDRIAHSLKQATHS